MYLQGFYHSLVFHHVIFIHLLQIQSLYPKKNPSHKWCCVFYNSIVSIRHNTAKVIRNQSNLLPQGQTLIFLHSLKHSSFSDSCVLSSLFANSSLRSQKNQTNKPSVSTAAPPPFPPSRRLSFLIKSWTDSHSSTLGSCLGNVLLFLALLKLLAKLQPMEKCQNSHTAGQDVIFYFFLRPWSRKLTLPKKL